MKLVTAAQMRALEDAAFASGTTQPQLMENAGRAIAVAIRERLGGARARRIVVLVGPGNNGGDGLIAARHLYDFGADVLAYVLAPRPGGDTLVESVRSRGIEVVDLSDRATLDGGLQEALDRADVVIDAVLGIGRFRPLDGLLAAVFDQLRGRRAQLFAIDLPTGIDADSGAADPHAAPADLTLTLGFSKIGLHTLPGSEYAGQVEVLDIGLERHAGDSIQTELLTPEWARERLPQRPAESNKGTFGRVLSVAGSVSFTGASALAAIGALRAGAGLVTLAAIPAVRSAVVPAVPEVTYLPVPELDGGIDEPAGDLIVRALPAYSALLIGPGLGLANGTQAVVRGVLTSPAVEGLPVVIDADALNALARLPGWHDELKTLAVLTPHPGELARLVGKSVAEVQQARVDIARECAGSWRQTVVLKGAHTIVARPDGQAIVSPYATAALATAGTGDVLAGAIAGLIAQGVELYDAAGLAVYLHGAAAEAFRDDYGHSGLLASELGPALARAAERLRRGE
jgi:NAD(P)H-hydrate epimerase